MKGSELYSMYCHTMSQLPYAVTKGEALPAWEFVDGPLALAWTSLGAQLVRAPRAIPVKKKARGASGATLRKSTKS